MPAPTDAQRNIGYRDHGILVITVCHFSHCYGIGVIVMAFFSHHNGISVIIGALQSL